jgi:isopropylmalate/homocitrate/citramalate synthase
MRFFESNDELYVDPRAYLQHLDLPEPATLRIYDTTLRDGEQTPGVALTPKQKLEIARLVSRLGIHIIDVGFPAVTPSERETLRLILEAQRDGEIRRDLEILIMCRADASDIDAGLRVLHELDAPLDQVTFLIFTSASNLHVKYKLGEMLLRRAGRAPAELQEVPLEWFCQENQQMLGKAIGYARSRGVRNIEFGAEDSSRTPIAQLIALVQTAVDNGADRFIFADTTGSLTPESTAFYCDHLRRAFPTLPLVSHFHNDYDLATINTITACLHGMTIFSVTLNGIGERAGNAALHSVVTALSLRYGLTIPGFRYDLLCEASSVVERLTGVPVQINEPVIGSNAFTHESGIHVHGVLHDPSTYESIPAEFVGAERRLVFGKHSGLTGVRHVLLKMEPALAEEGIVVDDQLALAVLDRVKLIRNCRAESGEAAQIISEHKRNMRSLSLSEADVIEVARSLAGSTRHACTATAVASVPIAR